MKIKKHKPIRVSKEKVKSVLIGEHLVNSEFALIEGPQENPKYFSINSPFKTDKRRSCTVSFSGAVRCYKTDTYTDIIGLIAHIHSIDRDDAADYFKANYGIWYDFLPDRQNEAEEVIGDDIEEGFSLDWNFIKFNPERHTEFYDYLRLDRGIDDSIIRSLELYVDYNQFRIVFPAYDASGVLKFFTGRCIKIDSGYIPWFGRGIKHGTYYRSNIESLDAYIVEGIFDALKIPGGRSLLGRFLSDETKFRIIKDRYRKIVVVMDNDSPGLSAQFKIGVELSELHPDVYFFNWSMVDPSIKDFGEMEEVNIDSSFLYKADRMGQLKWKMLNYDKLKNEEDKKVVDAVARRTKFV
jgi:hypothetical protein